MHPLRVVDSAVLRREALPPGEGVSELHLRAVVSVVRPLVVANTAHRLRRKVAAVMDLRRVVVRPVVDTAVLPAVLRLVAVTAVRLRKISISR